MKKIVLFFMLSVAVCGAEIKPEEVITDQGWMFDAVYFGGSVVMAECSTMKTVAEIPSTEDVARRIYNSTDFGATWRLSYNDSSRYKFHPVTQNRYYYTPSDFYGICPIDEDLAIAVRRHELDQNFAPFSSTNGGESWERIGESYFDYIRIYPELKMLDPLNGYLINYKQINDLDSDSARVFVTSDGCLTWRECVFPDYYRLVEIFDFEAVSADELILVARKRLGDFQIARTTDAGFTWTKTVSPFTYFGDIDAVNIDNMFLTYVGSEPIEKNCQRVLYKSEDQFATLDLIGTFEEDAERCLPNVAFFDARRGAVIAQKEVYLTADGGATWDRFGGEDLDSLSVGDARFVSETVALIACDGKVFRVEYPPSSADEEGGAEHSISPNPASPGETIAVSVPGSAGQCRVRLLDGFGRTISEIEEVAANSKLEFRLPEGLASGIYWLRIECGEQIFVEKFVVLE